MAIKEYLEQLKQELESEMDDYSIDFANERDVEDSYYFGDAITEFADSNTSIYYADQRAYYNEHSSDCDDALLEMYDGDSIIEEIKRNGVDGLLCKAGAIGEFRAIENAIYGDQENVAKHLALSWLIENCDSLPLTEERVNEILDEVEGLDVDRINDIKDAIDSVVESWEDEQ